MATVSRAGSAASEAAPIIEAGALRVLGMFGALLSLSGDTPQDASVLESQRYPYVNSKSLDAGKTALADFNQCHPDDMNKLPGGKGFQSFQSFDALKNALGNLPTDASGKPYEVHHLVGQNQTATFGTEAIQNTANTVPIPKSVHEKISAFYNRSAADAGLKNADGTRATGRVRDYVGKMPYADQRKFGIDTTRDYVAADKTLGTSDKTKILKQLDDLEKVQPDNCAEVK